MRTAFVRVYLQHLAERRLAEGSFVSIAGAQAEERKIFSREEHRRLPDIVGHGSGPTSTELCSFCGNGALQLPRAAAMSEHE